MHDVLLLAGGASRRMRPGPDKLSLTGPDGDSLLIAAIRGAVASGAARVVVVGPSRGSDGDVDLPAGRVRWTVEDPPGGGPVAGLAAGLTESTAPTVVVVAADMPAAAEAFPALLAGARPGLARVLVDVGGRRTLCLAVRRADVVRALEVLGDPRDRSVGALLSLLSDLGTRVEETLDAWGAATDVDTPADARRLGWRP